MLAGHFVGDPVAGPVVFVLLWLNRAAASNRS